MERAVPTTGRAMAYAGLTALVSATVMIVAYMWFAP